MRPVHLRGLALLALTALAACSGGGSAVPRTAASTTSPASGARATLAFKRLASTVTASAKRRTQELSVGANGLVVDAAQGGTSVFHTVIDISPATIDPSYACTGDASGIYQICTVQLLLPVGDNMLTIATNSARDGSGSTLGSATVPFTVAGKTDNAIAVTLDGIAAAMRLSVSDPQPASGSTTTLALTTQLYDAAGFIFISPQNYTQPVVLADGDTTPATMLFTQTQQNSTQRWNGTPVANPAPSAQAKSVNLPDRYTEGFIADNGATAPFTITGTFGSLTASVTVTPSAATPRPAGTQQHVFAWPSAQPQALDPIYDTNGNLWVTVGIGTIVAVDTTTYQPGATYLLPGAGARSLRSPAIGPDGAIYLDSGTISNGVTTGPWFVTRFDPVSHTFTDYPATSQVFHLVSTPSGLWGAERSGNLWHLPFASGVASAAPSELPVSLPPVKDTAPALVPLPTRVFPSTDGNLWVVETSYASVDGTWLAKYSPSGTKLSEALVDPQHPALELDAAGIDATGGIWYTDFQNLNEVVRQDTVSGALSTYVVPRLYGDNVASEVTNYATLDAGGNFWFVSYLDSRVGRIDRATGRVDLFAGAAGNLRGLAIGGTSGTLVMAGFNGPSFLVTLNTQ